MVNAMKKVYGYIRVSTVKQGTGVSLIEQKEAIIRYAEKHDLKIAQWFEELETAAKQGRPLFNKMIKLLKRGKGQGVIIHKIDRSARNLKDWAVLGDLIDQGIDVHFAHESLDMETRGGRLAADIQAVIASDYIRNLRDEAIKGIYGRLKQGIYPFYAPLGYTNNGGGKVKSIDPIRGPLVKKAFELYAGGKYNLHTLVDTMHKMGLRNARGNAVSVTRMSCILHNPFYTGVLKVKGRTFGGAHTPLISEGLYSKVQDILRGKTNTRPSKHDFLFRRILKCTNCGYSLIGEKQKGNVYYRCHTRTCPTKGVREEKIEKVIIDTLAQIRLDPLEYRTLKEMLIEAQYNLSDTQKGLEESLELQKANISLRLERLTDAYIDGAVNKDVFERKKEALLVEQQSNKQQTLSLSVQKSLIFKKAENFLELIKSLNTCYSQALGEEKRKILEFVTSNLSISGKSVVVSMGSPFSEISNQGNFSSCALNRSTPRTCTPEIVNNDNVSKVSGENSGCECMYPTHVVDLTINQDTREVIFQNSRPIRSPDEELRDRMKLLLDIILSFFKEQEERLENGDLEEEKALMPERLLP